MQLKVNLQTKMNIGKICEYLLGKMWKCVMYEPRPNPSDLNLGAVSFASSDAVIYNKKYIFGLCSVSGTELQKRLEFLKWWELQRCLLLC